MPILTEIEMREAIQQRDKAFDGHFYYGVITTGIFCQPSCPSKAAKPENMRLFLTLEAAMTAGFRACKRCHPVDSNERSEKLIAVVRHIEIHADEKLTLASLAEIALLSPSILQKEFKKLFGISPKVYQDALRMRHFKSALQAGEAVTDAIYGAGFGSISRVYGESTRNIGMTPKAYRAGGADEHISYASRMSALGLMMMAATDKGICFVQFADDEADLLTQLKGEFPHASLSPSASQGSIALDEWMEALNQHLSAGAPRPDLPLDIKGTVFQMQVWQFLLTIKEGEVMSYGEVAEQMGAPNAARAVGTACGKNRIAVLIPCHRVLRGDGGLGGYRWGLARKRTLLAKERGQ